MGLLTGKKGIIFGIANDRSYAFGVAKQLRAHGAEIGFTYLPMGKMEHRVRKCTTLLDIENPWLVECDANDDESLDAVFNQWDTDHDRLDFVIHSIAFADKNYLAPDKFHQTPRDVYKNAIDTSAYTLVAMANRAMPLMQKTTADKPEAGGAIVNLSYYGGEKVTARYNVMGVAKAALEHSTRYLAVELGAPGRNIRVNSISAGPMKTLAGAGVSGMDEMIKWQELASSMKRCNTLEEVGDTAVYLASDLSTGVTGEVIHVDCGYSIIGVPELADVK